MNNVFRTEDKRLAVLLIALGATSYSAESISSETRKKSFVFPKEFAEPIVHLWRKNDPILVDIREVFRAENIVNSLIYDEI